MIKWVREGGRGGERERGEGGRDGGKKGISVCGRMSVWVGMHSNNAT